MHLFHRHHHPQPIYSLDLYSHDELVVHLEGPDMANLVVASSALRSEEPPATVGDVLNVMRWGVRIGQG